MFPPWGQGCCGIMRVFVVYQPSSLLVIIMPTILALDTSTEACSVALLSDGEITEDYRLLPREHTRHLLPMVDAMLAGQQLSLRDVDAIAFGCGPGSFTGLRVCVGVVQGLAYGSARPVVPVSTLKALAQTAVMEQRLQDGQCILAAIDARMDEIYWAAYQYRSDSGLVALGKEQLSAPEAITLPAIVGESAESPAPWLVVGSGWSYRQRLGFADQVEGVEALLPHAAAIAKLGAASFAQGLAVSADQAVPTYLRDEVAWR